LYCDILLWGLTGLNKPLAFPRFLLYLVLKKILSHSHPVAGSYGRPMYYLSRKCPFQNTAKGEIFVFLNWFVFHLTHKFPTFFLRWTNGLPDRVHRDRVGGNGGWNGVR